MVGLSPDETESRGATAIYPHYAVDVVGLGERKSMQPTAARQGGLSYDRVQHSISIGRFDEAPVARMLLVKTDRKVSRRRHVGER